MLRAGGPTATRSTDGTSGGDTGSRQGTGTWVPAGVQIVGTTSARHCPLRPPLTLAPIEAGTVGWADMTAHVSAAHAARMYGVSLTVLFWAQLFGVW